MQKGSLEKTVTVSFILLIYQWPTFESMKSMKRMDGVRCGYSDGYGYASLAFLTCSDWLHTVKINSFAKSL